MDGGVGHTAWAPEGREGRSQAGPKGRQLEVGPLRGPSTLYLSSQAQAQKKSVMWRNFHIVTCTHEEELGILVVDAAWCWLIPIDADWFSLRLIDSDCCWLLLIDADWCWLMLILVNLVILVLLEILASLGNLVILVCESCDPGHSGEFGFNFENNSE